MHLSETVAQLVALRAGTNARNPALRSDKLKPLDTFGSNPGNLGAWYHVPTSASENAPLVVVLHGCTQNAAAYDHGSGWSELAEEQGFVVLLPEQRAANNPTLCFNWFEPADTRRGSGEPLSIIQMIDALVAQEGLNPARVFITGLSAGGAMTSVMLATYPEKFAGGAVVAGLPYGAAHGVSAALERMRGHGIPSARALAAAVTRHLLTEALGQDCRCGMAAPIGRSTQRMRTPSSRSGGSCSVPRRSRNVSSRSMAIPTASGTMRPDRLCWRIIALPVWGMALRLR